MYEFLKRAISCISMRLRWILYCVCAVIVYDMQSLSTLVRSTVLGILKLDILRLLLDERLNYFYKYLRSMLMSNKLE